mgnify:CR=1 FL=1
MSFSSVKNPLHKHAPGVYRRLGWPVFFLLLSFLLMILPLEGFVASVKAVLAYVFIPQVRVSHQAVAYGQDVSHTVQELLRAHAENEQLKQEKERTQLLAAQAKNILAENERLTQLLQLAPTHPWKGVWAQVAYREPARWNTVVIDKGSEDGIQERSAVIALENGQEGLAGVVIETTDKTAKVLLVRDEDFSAAVHLERTGEEGLLMGDGPRAVQVKYIPLLAEVEKGDKVYTSASSSIFPAGILVGEVSGKREGDGFQTSLTVYVTPQIRSSAIQEMFVILDKEISR